MVIKVDREICEMLEALNYETESRKDLISFMLERDADMSTNATQKYVKEYREFFAQYQMAKAEVEKKYVLPHLTGNEKINWNLDFTTMELTINILGE